MAKTFQSIVLACAFALLQYSYALNQIKSITKEIEGEPFRNLSAKEALRNLSPTDVGALHNKVVMQVHDRMIDNPPNSGSEYSKIVTEEMLTLCEDGDSDCVQTVRNTIHQSQREVREIMESGDSFDVQSLFPDELDDEVRNNLLHIYDSVYLIEEKSLDEALAVMNSISEKIAQSDTSEANKAAVQAVASVAIGSSKLWVEARDDPENTFHQMHARRRVLEARNNVFRRVQENDDVEPTDEEEERGFLGTVLDLTLTVVRFVLLDVVGAIKGVVMPLVLFVVGLTSPVLIATSVTFFSLTDSLGAVGIVIPGVFEVLGCWVIKRFWDCGLW